MNKLTDEGRRELLKTVAGDLREAGLLLSVFGLLDASLKSPGLTWMVVVEGISFTFLCVGYIFEVRSKS